jgi:hypothetical protein
MGIVGRIRVFATCIHKGSEYHAAPTTRVGPLYKFGVLGTGAGDNLPLNENN